MAAQRYSTVAMTLHWAIAACILSMIPMGWWMTAAIEDPARQALAYRVFQIHKSIGFLILALTLVRVGWRLTHRPPALPGGMKRWEGFAANATHVAFYALMLGLPLTGWLYVSTGWAVSQDRALEVATSWFGLFPVPHLPIVAELATATRRGLAFMAMGAHAAMAWGAVVLIALHVGAALKHQFIDRDGVLGRMVPGLKPAAGPTAVALEAGAGSRWAERVLGLALILVVAAAGAVAARAPSRTVEGPTPIVAPAEAAEADTPPPETEAAPAATAASAAADRSAAEDTPAKAAGWTIDSRASEIAFAGSQSGEAFNGRFERWSGRIRFDPADLAGSKAVITVQTASARTGDSTQEGSIQGADWFDIGQYPTARFETTGFRALGGDRYQATGRLRIKASSVRVVLPFTFRETGGVATVEGRLQLDRTALNLGMDSDATGDWVSKMVDVRIKVRARRAE